MKQKFSYLSMAFGCSPCTYSYFDPPNRPSVYSTLHDWWSGPVTVFFHLCIYNWVTQRQRQQLFLLHSFLLLEKVRETYVEYTINTAILREPCLFVCYCMFSYCTVNGWQCHFRRCLSINTPKYADASPEGKRRRTVLKHLGNIFSCDSLLYFLWLIYSMASCWETHIPVVKLI